MAPFVVTQESPLVPADAWARLTDWRRHGEFVPLTKVRLETAPPTGVGTVFTARTAVGRLGFDDPMEVVAWSPPAHGSGGSCRLEKRGRVMLGWAELSVQPDGPGSIVTWREDAVPAKLPAFATGVATLSGRLLFSRVMNGLLTR
ncbi:SRPBCC family protein [uncultured Jatrophihabitans sp.]|uniref:SRPBCC family protein n=1 Tax=uncultured Jatrophihabitans sp. TaxID=1610747 RepID=UPI0035C96210